MSAPRVPRRASTKGGLLLLMVLVGVVPGLLVAVPLAVLTVAGEPLAPGQLGKGYALAAGGSALFALLLGGAAAWRNRRARPAFDAAAAATGLRVDGAGYLGDIALLGVRDGVALELAYTVAGRGRPPVIVGTAASAAPEGLKLWAFAPDEVDPPFGTPPLPPFVSPEAAGPWRRWEVPAAALARLPEGLRLGGAVDEQGQRVTGLEVDQEGEVDAVRLEALVGQLLAAHAAWAPPRGGR